MCLRLHSCAIVIVCTITNVKLKRAYSSQRQNNTHTCFLMFVPCIIKRSRNNQHYAQICTTALFYILSATCFGSTLPSSGSFWIRMSYIKIQIDWVVHHIILVKWPVCRSVVVPSVVLPSWEYTPLNRSVFSCNSGGSRSSLKMADYCRNM
jgi:hypothetical protein